MPINRLNSSFLILISLYCIIIFVIYLVMGCKFEYEMYIRDINTIYYTRQLMPISPLKLHFLNQLQQHFLFFTHIDKKIFKKNFFIFLLFFYHSLVIDVDWLLFHFIFGSFYLYVCILNMYRTKFHFNEHFFRILYVFFGTCIYLFKRNVEIRIFRFR